MQWLICCVWSIEVILLWSGRRHPVRCRLNTTTFICWALWLADDNQPCLLSWRHCAHYFFHDVKTAGSMWPRKTIIVCIVSVSQLSVWAWLGSSWFPNTAAGIFSSKTRANQFRSCQIQWEVKQTLRNLRKAFCAELSSSSSTILNLFWLLPFPWILAFNVAACLLWTVTPSPSAHFSIAQKN